MATRAERYRSDAERTGRAQRKATRKPRKGTWSHDKAHAASKATHALEESSGRPSRESTRGSANRAKSDTAFNLTEEKRKGAPQAVARRGRARRSRVRGSSNDESRVA
jgi:hypothetical protein